MFSWLGICLNQIVVCEKCLILAQSVIINIIDSSVTWEMLTMIFHALFLLVSSGVLKPSVASTAAKGGNIKQSVAPAGTKAGEKFNLHLVL